jgi:hypothetical protein
LPWSGFCQDGLVVVQKNSPTFCDQTSIAGTPRKTKEYFLLGDKKSFKIKNN